MADSIMAFGYDFKGAAMLFKHLVSSLACAAILGACATKAPPPPPPTLAVLMERADSAIEAGKNEEGVLLLKSAIAAFPLDKAPRLRIAQVQFDCHNYGEAIFHAQEVVDRDPDDLVAHSLLAVSGLRVSSKALSDLAIKNNLTGNVRAEAQDLAKILRANIGGDIIPAPNPTPHPKTPSRPTNPPVPSTPVPKDGPAQWLEQHK